MAKKKSTAQKTTQTKSSPQTQTQPQPAQTAANPPAPQTQNQPQNTPSDSSKTVKCLFCGFCGCSLLVLFLIVLFWTLSFTGILPMGIFSVFGG